MAWSEPGPAPVNDLELAAAIAAASKDLTEAGAESLIHSALLPLATTARLKLLNDYTAKHESGSSEGRDFLAMAMNGIFWGTPRDLASSPAGFGGQSLIPETLDKIARARAMLDARGARAELEVDGGVKAENIAEVVSRGARVVVAGSAIFVGGQGIQANTATLRSEIARTRI